MKQLAKLLIPLATAVLAGCEGDVTIAGKVIDKVSGEPLDSVNVVHGFSDLTTTANSYSGDYSNANGEFSRRFMHGFFFKEERQLYVAFKKRGYSPIYLAPPNLYHLDSLTVKMEKLPEK